MAWLKIKGALGQRVLEERDTSSSSEPLWASRYRRKSPSPAAREQPTDEQGYNDTAPTTTDAGDVGIAPNHLLLDIAELQPEVIVISPKKGPVTGDTRLMIRGNYLGTEACDIVALIVCGVDCLATLEYESPSTIYCTTALGQVGTGPVTMETTSGGWAVSLATFTYVEVAPEPKKQSSWYVSEGRKGKLSKKASKTTDTQPFTLDSSSPKKLLWEELGRAQKENADLQRENDSMRSYIEQLLPRVLALCPEALCCNDTDAE